MILIVMPSISWSNSFSSAARRLRLLVLTIVLRMSGIAFSSRTVIVVSPALRGVKMSWCLSFECCTSSIVLLATRIHSVGFPHGSNWRSRVCWMPAMRQLLLRRLALGLLRSRAFGARELGAGDCRKKDAD